MLPPLRSHCGRPGFPALSAMIGQQADRMTERQTVLIVGASAGIGRALANEFARKGYDLILVARRPEPLALAATEISSEFKIQTTHLALDATAIDAPDRITAAIDATGHRLAYAVIGIGVWEDGAAMALPRARLSHILESNVTAPHALAVTLIPRLAATGGLLFIGSLAGTLPLPWISAYAASKACLHANALALRQELAATGPGVSVLAPGFVRTDFVPRTTSLRLQSTLELLASSPETVARAAFRGLLANRSLIVPGLFWRALWLGMRCVPASLVAAVTRRLIAGGMAVPPTAPRDLPT